MQSERSLRKVSVPVGICTYDGVRFVKEQLVRLIKKTTPLDEGLVRRLGCLECF